MIYNSILRADKSGVGGGYALLDQKALKQNSGEPWVSILVVKKEVAREAYEVDRCDVKVMYLLCWKVPPYLRPAHKSFGGALGVGEQQISQFVPSLC